METNESIFKEVILEHLDAQLIDLGYTKVEEIKGYFKYPSAKNYLKLIYEWNQTLTFYCNLGFDSSDYEYSFKSLIQKLEHDKEVEKTSFGKRGFSIRVKEWVNELSNKVSKYEIQNIDKDHPTINELRNEFQKRNNDYNLELQIKQLTTKAENAWSENDFKSFVKIIEDKTIGLPKSYDKKLSIAKRKIKEENNS